MKRLSIPTTGEELRSYRLSLGYTRREMADLLGYTYNHLDRLENGAKKIMPHLKAALCNIPKKYACRT